jgi:hypothetical protein
VLRRLRRLDATATHALLVQCLQSRLDNLPPDDKAKFAAAMQNDRLDLVGACEEFAAACRRCV